MKCIAWTSRHKWPCKGTDCHYRHCMLLQAWAASGYHLLPSSRLLYRIRALGLWLSEEGETVTSESVESLRQHLSTIENDLGGIVDHIAVCFKSLDTKPGT